MRKGKVVSFPDGKALPGAFPVRPARLKAERVQEPQAAAAVADQRKAGLQEPQGAVVAERLTAERVQEPFAVAATVPGGFVIELSTRPPLTMAVELYESKLVITLLGNYAGETAGEAG